MMLPEFWMAQVVATVILTVFSVFCGLWCSSLGFSEHDLRSRRAAYAERRQTPIGQLVQAPRLLADMNSRTRVWFRFSLPIVLNAALLLILLWRGLSDWVPLLPLPAAAAEFMFLRWWWRQTRTPYLEDFERYMRMTNPRNQCVVGAIVDKDLYSPPTTDKASQLKRGGRIVSLRVPPSSGTSEKIFRLFFPFSAYALPPDGTYLRVFYHPKDRVDGRRMNGVIVGWEVLARTPEPLPSVRSETPFDSLAERQVVG